jgi:hypothetical protein
MNPPSVYEETRPSTQRMIRIIARVSSIGVSPEEAVYGRQLNHRSWGNYSETKP